MPVPLEYTRTLFRERQHFRGAPAIIIGLVLSTMVLLLAAIGWFPTGRLTMGMVVPMLGTIVAIAAVVFSQTLVTTVTSHELIIRFVPFRTRRIAIHDIVDVAACEYRAMRDFGGWGIKWSLTDGATGYTMSGNRAVRLHTARKEKLVVGSRRPDELVSAILAASRQTGGTLGSTPAPETEVRI
jgi:hypothetical protein